MSHEPDNLWDVSELIGALLEARYDVPIRISVVGLLEQSPQLIRAQRVMNTKSVSGHLAESYQTNNSNSLESTGSGHRLCADAPSRQDDGVWWCHWTMVVMTRAHPSVPSNEYHSYKVRPHHGHTNSQQPLQPSLTRAGTPVQLPEELSTAKPVAVLSWRWVKLSFHWHFFFLQNIINLHIYQMCVDPPTMPIVVHPIAWLTAVTGGLAWT